MEARLAELPVAVFWGKLLKGWPEARSAALLETNRVDVGHRGRVANHDIPVPAEALQLCGREHRLERCGSAGGLSGGGALVMGH